MRICLALLFASACAGQTSPAADPDAAGGQSLGTCGQVARFQADNVAHVSIGTEVEYTSNPPSIGNHYGQWLAWGHYDEPLDPRYYVHNLEHGGMALLYDCAALDDPARCEADVIAPLKAWANAVGEDDGGPFRFVSSPFDLGVPVAAATWGWTYRATCVDPAALDAFKAAHYRKAPEDIASGGGHQP